MLQNLKNFLIAFIIGLVVFGTCAIIIVSSVMNTSPHNDVTPANEQVESLV